MRAPCSTPLFCRLPPFARPIEPLDGGVAVGCKPVRVRLRAGALLMTFIRLYLRVFSMLGPEKRLGVVLALANVLLAAAQFAEPVLFGRIIDALIGSQT